MASIALKVRVDGTDRAVKNIDQLEKAVEDLKQELKGTDIGSENFRQLSGELQRAQSQLKTFEKEFEGLEPQQRTEAFVKLGEGIAGAFAIATTALTTFGVESEEVEQAQLAVTQALTIAVGARQIAEAGLNLRIVANIVSQKAYNLATVAGTAVTRTFFRVIAANPITAIVTAVAALAAGIYALVQAMDTQITAQEQINDALDDSRKKTIQQEVQLKSLQSIVNDTTASEDLRRIALERLQKLLPQLEGLELDNKDAIDQVNSAVRTQITLIQQRAKAEALSQLVVEKTKELIEEQTKDLDDNLSFWERTGNYLISGFNPIVAETRNTITAVNNSQKEQQAIQGEINEITEVYVDVLDDLLILEEEEEKIIEGNNRRKERQTQIERQRTEAVRDQIKSIQDLGNALAFDYGEPKVLQDLRALNEEIQQFSKEQETFRQEAERLFVIPETNIGDVFGKFYDEAREDLSNTITGELADFQKTVNETLAEGARLAQLAPEEGGITIEAFVTLQNLVGEYSNLRALIEDTPSIKNVLGEGDPLNFFNNLRKQLIANGDIIFKETEGRIELLGDEERNIQDLVSARTNFAEAEKELTRIIRERLQAQVESGELTAQEADELATARTQSIIQLSRAITIQEEEIRGVLFETQKVQEEVADNQRQTLTTTNEAYKNFVLQNLDSLSQFYDETLKSDDEFFDGQKLNREELAELENEINRMGLQDYKNYINNRKIDANDLINLETELAKQGIDLTDFTAEERIKILEAFYNRKKQLRDEDATDEKEVSEGFLDNLADNLSQVAQVAQTGVQVFQQYVQTQLTILQDTEKGILDQIVGDSEEAEQKRTEIREQYENERKQITKQGQLAQLELTRLQAVANVAEAVTKALAAGPVTGQILAGVAAAIGAIQVGFISSQISQVRNLRQGGILFGASHEQGGIPFGNTGVFAEGGEVVINRQSSVQYRDLLSSINMAGGGRPLVSQPFDDSRLIEALTKTNREPIRAYVLEQDITEKQGINQRLQLLSKI